MVSTELTSAGDRALAKRDAVDDGHLVGTDKQKERHFSLAPLFLLPSACNISSIVGQTILPDLP
jgi:hypothetical protein